MMFRDTRTHSLRGHVCGGILNMATMRPYSIFIGFKDMT